MKFYRKGKWIAGIAALMVLCLTAANGLHAQDADTFISEEYEQYCQEAGAQYGICPELLMAIMEAESSGNSSAANGSCKGLMQINQNYHKDRMECLGVTDIYDGRSNVMLAADYLSELFLKYQDPGTVLMVYNGSKDAVKRGERGDYTAYATGILERSAQLERMHGK